MKIARARRTKPCRFATAAFALKALTAMSSLSVTSVAHAQQEPAAALATEAPPGANTVNASLITLESALEGRLVRLLSGLYPDVSVSVHARQEGGAFLPGTPIRMAKANPATQRSASSFLVMVWTPEGSDDAQLRRFLLEALSPYGVAVDFRFLALPKRVEVAAPPAPTSMRLIQSVPLEIPALAALGDALTKDTSRKEAAPVPAMPTDNALQSTSALERVVEAAAKAVAEPLARLEGKVPGGLDRLLSLFAWATAVGSGVLGLLCLGAVALASTRMVRSLERLRKTLDPASGSPFASGFAGAGLGVGDRADRSEKSHRRPSGEKDLGRGRSQSEGVEGRDWRPSEQRATGGTGYSLQTMDTDAAVALIADCYWSKSDAYASFLWKGFDVATRKSCLESLPFLREYILLLATRESTDLGLENDPSYLDPLPTQHLDNVDLLAVVRALPALFTRLSALRQRSLELPLEERLRLARAFAQGDEAGERRLREDAHRLLAGKSASPRRTLDLRPHIPTRSDEDERALGRLAADLSSAVRREIPTLVWALHLNESHLRPLLESFSARDLAEAWSAPEEVLARLAACMPAAKSQRIQAMVRISRPDRTSEAFLALSDALCEAFESEHPDARGAQGEASAFDPLAATAAPAKPRANHTAA